MRTALLFILAISLAWALATPAAAQTDFWLQPATFCPATGGGTQVQYTLLQTDTITLDVLDSWSGQRVRRLVDGAVQAAGYHTVWWDGRDDQGSLLETRSFTLVLSGIGWLNDHASGAINCGNDLGAPVCERAGEKDVTLSFWMSLNNANDVELDLFEADGVTPVDHLYSGSVYQMLGITWSPIDAPGAPLPAGDYLCRLTSSQYSEDVPFHLDPATPAAMTAVITDGDGSQVTGFDDSNTLSAQVYSPLQQAVIAFDRPLNGPEWEYLLGGGLRWTGRMANLRPGPVVVAPDSASATVSSFDPTLAWKDLLGGGAFWNYGLLEPGAARFRLGFHHDGITAVGPGCTRVGPADPDDWQITGEHNLDLPCPNPVAPGLATQMRIYLNQEEWTAVRVFDEGGNLVRTLVQDYLQGGGHTLTWDLTDTAGAPVTDGIYHLVWASWDLVYDRELVVTSGDIQVWSLSAVSEDTPPAASAARLLPNHPNPFNGGTSLDYVLGSFGRTRLTVHTLDGRLVATLLDGDLGPGPGSVTWDGRDANGAPLPSGTYLYRLKAGARVECRRMLLLK